MSTEREEVTVDLELQVSRAAATDVNLELRKRPSSSKVAAATKIASSTNETKLLEEEWVIPSTSVETGLSSTEANLLLKQHGRNEVVAPETPE